MVTYVGMAHSGDLSAPAGTSCTVTRPAGVVEGDLLVAQVLSRRASLSQTAHGVTAPAGWTLLAAQRGNESGVNQFTTVWTKVATAAEPATYTWTQPENQRMWAGVLAYRDAMVAGHSVDSGKTPGSPKRHAPLTINHDGITGGMVLTLAGCAYGSTIGPTNIHNQWGRVSPEPTLWRPVGTENAEDRTAAIHEVVADAAAGTVAAPDLHHGPTSDALTTSHAWAAVAVALTTTGPVTPEATAHLTATTGGIVTLDTTLATTATLTATTGGTAAVTGTVETTAHLAATTGGAAAIDMVEPGVVQATAALTSTTGGTAALAGTRPLAADLHVTTGGGAVLTGDETTATAALTVTTGGTATIADVAGKTWADAHLAATTGGTATLDATATAAAPLTATTGGTAWLQREWPKNPETGRAPYDLVIAHRDGTTYGALTNPDITAPVRARLNDVDGSATGTAFTLPARSMPDHLRQFREVQVHRAGHHLTTCVLLRPEHKATGGVASWLGVGLGWYLTKRRVGPAVRPELLVNPSFERGLTGWRPGWSKPSIPAKPPKVTVVTTDVITGDRALRVEGSTEVQTTVTRLGSDTTFAPGSAILSAEGKTALREFAKEVEVDRDPDDLEDIAPPVITIEGHTDDVPDYGPGGNQGLSERRAKAVYDYLAPLVPDGTTMTWVGYGATRPIVPNNPGTFVGTPQNRRVDIIYPKTVSARGHRQHVGQAIRYTNPSRHIKRNLTFVAWGTLETYKEPNVDGAIIWIGRRKPGARTYDETSLARIDDETPLATPTRWETSITVPADGQEWEIVVRLKPPAGTVIYDAASLKADDALEFIDADYSTIVAGLIEHAQDPAYDKDDLHLTADVRPTGHRTTRVYYWHERQTIASCLAELVGLVDGPDIHIDPVTRRVITRPRIGQDTTVTLATDTGILDDHTAATTVIVQADGSGADREEGVATGLTDDVDLVLEEVYTAEPGTRVGELTAQARQYHGLVAGHNPLLTLTCDGDDTDMLLDMLSVGDTADVDVPDPLLHVTGRHRIPGWSLDTRADRLTYTPEPVDA